MINKKKTAAFLGCALLTGGWVFGSSIRSSSASDIVKISEATFPDSKFREYVSQQFDTNKNGSLSASEISAVKSIDVSGDGSVLNDSISSLLGIEHFTALEFLYCSYNNISSLDLSKNTKLQWICVDHNRLTGLSLANNPQVSCLYCNNNQLTSLNLSGVTKLTYLDCSTNVLPSVDLSKNSQLIYCNLNDNAITSLNISANTKLDVLDVANNWLSTLDVSKNKSLSTLYCYGNRISGFSLNGAPILQATVSEYLSDTGSDPNTGVSYYYYYSRKPDDEFEGLKVDPGTAVTDPAPLPPTGLPFEDVYSNNWFLEAVFFVYNYGLMSGKSETLFDPNAAITRSEVVTVLYNKDDRVPTTYEAKFTDVPDGQWFSLPITWAAQGGVAAGYGDSFGTFDTITREQLATMLYNYTAYHQADVTYDDNTLGAFPDAGNVSDWAVTPVKWAVSHRIISGKQLTSGEIILDPSGQATRAECAQMIKNYMERLEGLNHQ